MNNYAAAHTPHLLDAVGISALFAKPRTWFSRDRVRKSLYARGFPQPVIRGRWLRTAVQDWLEQQGRRTVLRPPSRSV
jgi:hypothetical protein